MESPKEVQAAVRNRDAKGDPRDQFVRQVEDESLRAAQVLKEQIDERTAREATRLFVP